MDWEEVFCGRGGMRLGGGRTGRMRGREGHKKERGAGKRRTPESVCLYMCVDVLFVNHDNQVFRLLPKGGGVRDAEGQGAVLAGGEGVGVDRVD